MNGSPSAWGFFSMATLEEMMAAAWGALQAGDLDRAEQAYRRVLERDPTIAYAWYMLGAACHVRGRLEESVVNYQQALRLRPDFPEACNNLGVALHALRRSEESMDALRRALMLRPEYAEAHNNMGNALHDRGRL